MWRNRRRTVRKNKTKIPRALWDRCFRATWGSRHRQSKCATCGKPIVANKHILLVSSPPWSHVNCLEPWRFYTEKEVEAMNKERRENETASKEESSSADESSSAEESSSADESSSAEESSSADESSSVDESSDSDESYVPKKALRKQRSRKQPKRKCRNN